MSTEGAELWREGHDRQKDAERQAQLANLVQSGLSPEDTQKGIALLYQKDPSKLKEHVQNLASRLTGGKVSRYTPPTYQAPSTTTATPATTLPDGTALPASAPTTVTGPAPKTRQEALTSLVAKGKTKEQRALDETQGREDITNKGALDRTQQEAQQTQKQAEDLIRQYVPKEQQAAALEDFARKQTGINATLKNIPGAAGQPYQNADKQWVRAVMGANGPVEQAMPPGWTPPAAKPGQPKVGVSGGKNVYATLTPQGWVDAGTGKALADFRPLPTYAQEAPGLRAVQVVDPNDPGSTVYESIPEALKTRAKGTQSVDYKLQMPTGQERGRAQLASSAREQLGDMVDLLNKRGDLFGPGAGHITNFTQWVGSQDPDAQRFKAAAQIAADHLAGVFGGRSQAALAAIYDVVGKNITNPAAAIAGIQQMDKAAQNIQRSGGGPAPKQGTAKEGDTKVNSSGDKVKFHNGQWGPA